MSTSEQENQEGTEVEETEETPTEDTEVEETEETEEEPVDPASFANAEPKGKNISTLSTTEGMPEGWFDNYGTPDLRTYLKFWEDEKRSAGKAEQLLATEPEKWA